MAFKSLRGFDSRYTVLSDDVLYFGAAIWNGESQTWLEGAPGTGPLWVWETALDDQGSYRSELPPGWPVWGNERPELTPRGLDLPRAILLSVTVAQKPPIERSTRLVNGIGPTDTVITVLDANGFPATGEGTRYFRLGQEWIEYARVTGSTFHDCRRGARGTLARGHEPGTEVQGGLTLSRIVSIPGGR
jgi:hypothetical protein